MYNYNCQKFLQTFLMSSYNEIKLKKKINFTYGRNDTASFFIFQTSVKSRNFYKSKQVEHRLQALDNSVISLSSFPG